MQRALQASIAADEQLASHYRASILENATELDHLLTKAKDFASDKKVIERNLASIADLEHSPFVSALQQRGEAYWPKEKSRLKEKLKEKEEGLRLANRDADIVKGKMSANKKLEKDLQTGLKRKRDQLVHEDDSDTCPVCLDPFDEIEDRFLCKMRCGHKICEKCFLVLRSPKRCPTCRKEHPSGPIYLK
jgi:hypothetical protein